MYMDVADAAATPPPHPREARVGPCADKRQQRCREHEQQRLAAREAEMVNLDIHSFLGTTQATGWQP